MLKMTDKKMDDALNDYREIINWDSLYEQSESFQNAKPFRNVYVKGIFKENFYKKLYDSYPKFDESWIIENDWRRSAKRKNLVSETKINGNDWNSEWKKFATYVISKEFFNNIIKFTGIKVTRHMDTSFLTSEKGDFQLPHVDADGNYENKIQLIFYFSKNWQKGDPGGTFFCENEDEDSITFEPYDLDNSMICFEETPHSWHGTRYITKDVRRRAVLVSLT